MGKYIVYLLYIKGTNYIFYKGHRTLCLTVTNLTRHITLQLWISIRLMWHTAISGSRLSTPAVMDISHNITQYCIYTQCTCVFLSIVTTLFNEPIASDSHGFIRPKNWEPLTSEKAWRQQPLSARQDLDNYIGCSEQAWVSNSANGNSSHSPHFVLYITKPKLPPHSWSKHTW